MEWFTPERLAVGALTVSALSLLVAIVAAGYTRASHLKKVADEEPIFWAHAEHTSVTDVWRVTIHALNRNAAKLDLHHFAVTAPRGAGVRRVWDAGAWGEYGQWIESPAEAAGAAQSTDATMELAASGTPTVHSGGAIQFGDKGYEAFFVHLPPNRSRRRSSVEFRMTIRLIWSLKKSASRKRVEHVHITVSADTKAEAAET